MDDMEPQPTEELSENIHANLKRFAEYVARFPLRACSKCGVDCRALDWHLEGRVICTVCRETGGPPRTATQSPTEG